MQRTLSSCLLLTAVLLAADAGAGGIPPDKASHFAGGVASGAIATAVVDQFAPNYRLPGGVLLGTIPGLIIEIVDSTNDAGFSGGDLLADFLGSAVGALITDKVVLHFWFDDHGKDDAYGVEVAKTF